MIKKKILQLCEFSAGTCGVWSRVFQDSKELVKRGYEVYVFSSNQVKGSKEIAPAADEVDGVHIRRFPVSFQVGENALFWRWEKPFLRLKPDVVIAHGYRHPYTNDIIKYVKDIEHKPKVFLITHAPFVPRSLRGLKLHLFTKVYDHLYGGILKKFNKIIRITNWELPYLEDLDCWDSVYLPNGVPDEFFEDKIKQGKNILFLGRVAPVKNIEVLIRAVNDIDIKTDIVGPREEEYYNSIKYIVNNNQINFLPGVYGLKEKIRLIDAHEIFILPSHREGLPQSLIEAMARGKICIASDIDGAREVIKDGVNGLLFKNNDYKDLRDKINAVLKMSKKDKEEIQKQARFSAERFKISGLINNLEILIQ
jgi:glycosyltransferase involved in cell wall biosynthesis